MHQHQDITSCEVAYRKGVTTITSAGNEGLTSWRYIIAPADGFNTLAIGAVDANNIVAGFSSLGPTYDGRIKPDLVTRGVNVIGAAAGTINIDVGTISEDWVVTGNTLKGAPSKGNLNTEDKDGLGILDDGEDVGIDGLSDAQEPGNGCKICNILAVEKFITHFALNGD